MTKVYVLLPPLGWDFSPFPICCRHVHGGRRGKRGGEVKAVRGLATNLSDTMKYGKVTRGCPIYRTTLMMEN